MLRGDVGLVACHGLTVGVLEHALGERREGNVASGNGLVVFGGDLLDRGEGLRIGDVELGKGLGGDALPLLYQGQEQVLRPYIHLAEATRLVLRKAHDLARLVGELLEHTVLTPPPGSRADLRVGDRQLGRPCFDGCACTPMMCLRNLQAMERAKLLRRQV